MLHCEQRRGNELNMHLVVPSLGTQSAVTILPGDNQAQNSEFMLKLGSLEVALV